MPESAIGKIKKITGQYGQEMMNIYLFVTFAGWCGYQTFKTYLSGNLNFVEISFAVQNLVLVSLFLIRKKHKAINNNLFDQAIAIIAFCSGAAFIGQPLTGNGTAMTVSQTIVAAANIIGIMTLLNLRRSFGILIAYREIKTSGLYSIVRHPMYFSDILLRVGYLVSHCDWFTVSVFILSTGCYVYRAILEERFLSKQEDYAQYMKQVKYRFIPYVL
jgi:protein-S-isoprenylcysteine O-methyltransferase Ste14